jgi:uncharacterized protein with HEPN domain
MEVIDDHLSRGPEGDPLSDALVFDPVRVRLMKIGEAVKDRPGASTSAARTRAAVAVDRVDADRLAHRYFDIDRPIVTATCQRDLPELRAAVERLLLIVRDDG